MAQANSNRFSGEYMVQDSDHMSGIATVEKANRGNARQVEQSHDESRQQGGGDHHVSRQQGGERSGRRRAHQ